MSLISHQCCRICQISVLECIVWLKPSKMMEGSRSPQQLLFLITEQQEEDDRYSHMANKTVGKHLISCYWFLWMEGSYWDIVLFGLWWNVASRNGTKTWSYIRQQSVCVSPCSICVLKKDPFLLALACRENVTPLIFLKARRTIWADDSNDVVKLWVVIITALCQSWYVRIFN